MRRLKRLEDNQRSHSATDRNSQLPRSSTSSDLADPSIPQNETEMEDMDLTDRAVHKFVNEIRDQAVLEVGGSKGKAEERAENEPVAEGGSRDAAESGRDKISDHGESQAKSGKSCGFLCWWRILPSWF